MDPKNNIRALRSDRDVTLEQLAERSGLSVSYLHRLERGERNLSVKNIDKIAGALGVDRSELITIGALGRKAEAARLLDGIPEEAMPEVVSFLAYHVAKTAGR